MYIVRVPLRMFVEINERVEPGSDRGFDSNLRAVSVERVREFVNQRLCLKLESERTL